MRRVAGETLAAFALALLIAAERIEGYGDALTLLSVQIDPECTSVARLREQEARKRRRSRLLSRLRCVA